MGFFTDFLDTITGRKRLKEQIEEKTKLIQKFIEDHKNEVLSIRKELEKKNEIIKRYEIELENTVTLFQNIQRELLLNIPPNIKAFNMAAGYEAKEGLTGDFYGVLSRGDKVVFYIADASGHSVLSSFLGFLLHYYMKELTLYTVEPVEILTEINKRFQRFIPTSDYLTMFIMVVDSGNFGVIYSSASHQPALLYRKEKNELEFLNTDGLFVGALEDVDVHYEDSIDRLSPGDRVILYTKGLVEQLGDGNIESGEEKLKEMVLNGSSLSVKELLNELFKNLGALSSRRDDVAIFIFEVSPLWKEFIEIVNKANKWFSKGNYDKGVELLKDAYRILSGYKELLLQIAKGLTVLGRYDEAINYGKEYIQANPLDPEGYYIVGKSYRRIGKIKEALNYVLKAIELDRDHVNAMIVAGFCYRKLGDLNKALQYLKAASLLAPEKEKLKLVVSELEKELKK